MQPLFLDQLVEAITKRSKAIRYSNELRIDRSDWPTQDFVIIHISKFDNVGFCFSFDDSSFVEIRVEIRKTNRQLRRLAHLHPMHFDADPETIVRLCEESISLGRATQDDEWWRTIGQKKLESIWLAIGT